MSTPLAFIITFLAISVLVNLFFLGKSFFGKNKVDEKEVSVEKTNNLADSSSTSLEDEVVVTVTPNSDSDEEADNTDADGSTTDNTEIENSEGVNTSANNTNNISSNVKSKPKPTLIKCSPKTIKDYEKIDITTSKLRYSFYYPKKACSSDGKFTIYSQPLAAYSKTSCTAHKIYESSKYNNLYGMPVHLKQGSVNYFFFSPVLEACGSGFSGELKVLISKNDKTTIIRSLSGYNELSQYFKINDKCLVAVDSVLEKDESHFANHKLKVYAYKVDDKGNVKRNYLGQTLDKYSVVETLPLSKYLLNKEPWIKYELSKLGCISVDKKALREQMHMQYASHYNIYIAKPSRFTYIENIKTVSHRTDKVINMNLSVYLPNNWKVKSVKTSKYYKYEATKIVFRNDKGDELVLNGVGHVDIVDQLPWEHVYISKIFRGNPQYVTKLENSLIRYPAVPTSMWVRYVDSDDPVVISNFLCTKNDCNCTPPCFKGYAYGTDIKEYVGVSLSCYRGNYIECVKDASNVISGMWLTKGF